VEDIECIKNLIKKIIIEFTKEERKEAIRCIIDNKKGNLPLS